MIETALDFIEALTERIARLADTENRVAFWWRDDDAVEPTPALERLIGLSEKYAVPLALAVIPKPVDPALADRVAKNKTVTVLQHGWAHINHQPAGEKKAELGDARPKEVVLDELAEGHDRLTELFDDRFQPVLVPPWNRIAPDVVERRKTYAWLIGLSTFGPVLDEDPYQVNTHLDIIDWRGTRGFIGWQRAWDVLDREIALRLDGASSEPIGLLTHHLVHDEACWDFLDTFLGCLDLRPPIVWPTVPELFGFQY